VVTRGQEEWRKRQMDRGWLRYRVMVGQEEKFLMFYGTTG
jgi:hypothetical protein